MTIEAASDQYRSPNDPARKVKKKLLLLDTPGHGKLRHHALNYVVKPQDLKGVIFVVDGADLAPDSFGLREAAEYLHDILLSLQQKFTTSKSPKKLQALSILVAANKADLFTALPASLVGKTLETEISRIRESRAKGLLDSGIGMDGGLGPEKDWLGDTGEADFEFTQMAEMNIDVQVRSGSVIDAENPGVSEIWNWIAGRL